MCLITGKRSYKIAKEDIIVWKLLNPDDTSFIHSHPYKEGVMYKASLEFLDKGTMDALIRHDNKVRPADPIDSDFLKETYDWGSDSGYDDRLIFIRKGFHSYTSFERAIKVYGMCNYEKRLIKFMVPKGSRYILDDTGCCVSNRIIMSDSMNWLNWSNKE